MKKRGPKPVDLKLRFWRFVKKTKRCWLWTGALNQTTHGYGLIKRCDGPQGRRQDYAHRVSWELHRGKIPHGLFVLHDCDNPRCVRPKHLFLGTALDNVQDMVKKKRYTSNSSKVRGDLSIHRKLTEKQVKQILKAYRERVPICALARQYGMTHSGVSNIVHRRSWKHL